ncbi:hypothetical protein [Phytohabitans suffuscus]|uniref:hypothetical protein n=1 Tax=Phytohabitans suffuscus TaxID=624315 RepID=UPI0015635446|nr:hypothetical protein [Phytohabitans suffuscus]
MTTLASSTVLLEDDAEVVGDFFYRRGNTDGLPIVVPPTQRVARMLDGIDRDAHDRGGNWKRCSRPRWRWGRWWWSAVRRGTGQRCSVRRARSVPESVVTVVAAGSSTNVSDSTDDAADLLKWPDESVHRQRGRPAQHSGVGG